ncbi:MAG: metal-dependent hydrolase [Pseudomonadota bacterium]
MRYQWLGHASVRLEIEDQVLLIDPWQEGPTFPTDRADEALGGATAIVLTHGHFDHAAGVAELAKERGLTVYGMVELVSILGEQFGIEVTGFNKGGTVQIGAVALTMVAATHSSTLQMGEKLLPAGDPVGFMIAGEGKTVYLSGDTDVMADMAIWQDLHAPEIGILSAGGHFTMDMRRAAYAASKLFRFKTVIPYHYKTFPLLAQDASELQAALPGVTVHDPEVMEAIEL